MLFLEPEHRGIFTDRHFDLRRFSFGARDTNRDIFIVNMLSTMLCSNTLDSDGKCLHEQKKLLAQNRSPPKSYWDGPLESGS